jgi:AcrR family transcriptional regulator
MPTGVPLADGREQLFDAARRVLLREGASALTSRAVTAEAGVAKGVLHRYFADFDAFLAALAVAEIERIDAGSADLRGRAGAGTVTGNLAAALSRSLTPEILAVVELALSRHELLARLRPTAPTGIPLLAQITRMTVGYLTAERGLGRLALAADVDRLGLMLVGGAHLLAAGGADAGEIRKLVAAALADAGAEVATRPSRAPRPPTRTRPDR